MPRLNTHMYQQAVRNEDWKKAGMRGQGHGVSSTEVLAKLIEWSEYRWENPIPETKLGEKPPSV